MTSIADFGAIAPPTAPSASPPSPAEELVSADEFLTLLVAQLEHQNPLEPLDGTDYVSQLAEFASLEQLTQVNSGIGDVNNGQAGLLSQNSVLMLDREVTYPGNEITLNTASDVEFNYILNSAAGDLTLSVFNANGVKLGEVQNAPRQAGLNTFKWDGSIVGTDGNTTVLPEGQYTFEVSALDGSSPVSVQTFSSGRVTGVTYENGFPELMLGDKRVVPGLILKVRN